MSVDSVTAASSNDVSDQTWPYMVIRISSGLVMLVGMLALAGWTFGIPALIRIFPDSPNMKPLTALGFCFLGISLWHAIPKRSSQDVAFRVHQLGAFLVGCMGAIK